jgi:hypothetical protein
MSIHVCVICGEDGSAKARWFLIAENRWEDKLRIFQWDERLARQAGIHCACSASHVQELVVHWMTTGSLDYPFARVPSKASARRRRAASWPAADFYGCGARQIGELAVDRESMKRVLSESPQSLRVILDALLAALQHETICSDQELEAEAETPFAAFREI